jgi:hypothetical protein
MAGWDVRGGGGGDGGSRWRRRVVVRRKERRVAAVNPNRRHVGEIAPSGHSCRYIFHTLMVGYRRALSS